MSHTHDLTAAPTGVVVLHDFSGTPAGEHGVLATIELKLPETRAISHYTAFQRHDPPGQARTDQAIGGGNNRVQGLRITRWSEAIEGGLFAVLELADDDWLVLLPIAGRDTLAWLAPVADDGVALKIGTLGTEPVAGDLPALAWSRSKSVYAACTEAWRLALRHPLVKGLGRLRDEKPYPVIFNYLGWCSWEQHKRDIDSDILTDAARRINAGDLPVRFFLVDDGYHCHNETGKMMDDQLVRLGPNPKTFPQGWRPLLENRRDDGLRWFGLWQNHNGYWARIAADNQLGPELNAHLMDVPDGGRLPKPTVPDNAAWYEAFLGVARTGGFDFVKVDNQAKNLHNYRGTANAVQATSRSSQALERAAAGQVNGLINCMAHGPVCAFNTCLSAVTRCSEDYKVNDAWRAKAHLHNSYQNMLWLGPTVWGDHDMFHSSDTFAGRMMAVSKAMSGGPVYLSDDPDDFDADVVRPLCDNDGRLYRPLAPAVPLPRCVTLDPFEQPEPYVAAAPLAHGAVALVAYNLTEPEQPVSGRIVPADYRAADGFLDTSRNARPEPTEGLVLYDWVAGEACLLEDDGWAFALEKFADRLLLLCPIIRGWAVIGRSDKYLSPTAVTVRHVDRDCLVLESAEPATVTVWRDGELRNRDVPAGLCEWSATCD
ncbi:MAG: Sip1-related alpha-galactosidase [Verrucomicrobiota bacterium]